MFIVSLETCQPLTNIFSVQLMGIYIFAGSVLNFVPPLLFSALNEMEVNMSIGLASLNLFFAGGFIFLLMIGDYNDAVTLSQSENMVWTPVTATGLESPDLDVPRDIPPFT